MIRVRLTKRLAKLCRQKVDSQCGLGVETGHLSVICTIRVLTVQNSGQVYISYRQRLSYWLMMMIDVRLLVELQTQKPIWSWFIVILAQCISWKAILGQ